MLTLADVIIPAFALPFVSWFMVPVAGVVALATEIVVFRLINRRVDLACITWLVLLANFVSGLAGFIIALFLPTGIVSTVVQRAGQELQTRQPGPRYLIYVVLGYLLALVLSIALETIVVRQAKSWAHVDRPLKTVTWANLASYSALAIVSFGWWKLQM